jgi:hypothetical protein
MRTLRQLVAAALATCAIVALGPGARADEVSGLGVSLDGYIAPVFDSSVTVMNGPQPQHRQRGLIGFATLANFGSFAAGGVVDGFPGILGNGRLTVGGVAGWQPAFGRHRYQVLGELGAERFTDVGGTLFHSPGTHETWLDYVGARLGTSETFGSGGHFQLGAWLFVRKDLGDAVVSSTGDFVGGDSTPTQYRLGGYTAGAALRIGLRLDQKRSTAESTDVEPHEIAGI